MKNVPNRDVLIFSEALQLPPPERAAFLERVCGEDIALRQRVAALLQTYDQSGDFLEELPPDVTGAMRPAMSVGEKPGSRIGRYKLLQQIGEGGCGIVYMAEQEEPVRRRVALKIIKPGMDTHSVMARFEAERQALALMDHPNIAKVFDAGATESGRPYFVMELVRGVKITDFCDEHSLSMEERLRLFLQVCRAIQHAHQKGIIHRDIKPSNILVTMSEEGTPAPVVIDFGIAKATSNQRLTDKTLFTAFEMLIGTPAYMSPEQAEFSRVDADTRSDIYSLGVLLYELLTGATPFDSAVLMKSGIDEIRRVIREEEPARPSTRLRGMSPAVLTATAERRRSEAPGLVRSVRGDLDWIVMKALEKDRTRRYETANGLALDVQRFLADEPISARPPSSLYRLRKTVSRNRLLFASLSIIAMLLVTGLIVVTASLGRERTARRKAETEEARSQQITGFLKNMLGGVGTSVAHGRDTVMLREILDRTADRIGEEIGNQPTVEAEMRSLIGRLYLDIGNYDRAEKMHAAALAIHRKFAPRSKEVASSLSDLGMAFWKQRKLAEAEAAHKEALEIRRRLFGEIHAEVGASLNNLGSVYRRQRKLDEAETLIRQGLEIRRKVFGNEHLEVADSLHNLCVVLGDQGRRAESEATAREMLEMRRKLVANDDPLIAAALADLAWAVGFTGKLAEAESLETEALAIQRKILGDEHPDVAKSISSLGERMRQRGAVTEAHAVLNAALSIQRKLLGDDHPSTLDSLRGLGWTLEQEYKWREAEAAHREALAQWRKRAPAHGLQVITEVESLERVLVAQKQFNEADKLLAEAITPAVLSQPEGAGLLSQRADLKARRGQWEEAAADAALAVELRPEDSECCVALAGLLAKTRNFPAYEKLRLRILAFPEPDDLYAANKLAKSCLLLPASEIDLKMAHRLASRATTIGFGDEFSKPFFQVCKAVSEYRLGHFNEAVEWSQKSLAVPYSQARGQAYATLAMAQWRLGQKEAARAALAAGNIAAPPIMPKETADDSGKAWLAWIFATVTLDEAAQLIATSP